MTKVKAQLSVSLDGYAAGLLEERTVHLSPVLLHGGARLFDGVGDVRIEPVDIAVSPAATHVRYRVGG